MADACIGFTDKCLVGIEVNRDRVTEHLQNSLMLVTALNPHVGYDQAARIAGKAHKENTSLKQAALALGLVSEADFDRWVDPSSMI